MSAGLEHRFGPYGGQYVPETLMPALAELEAAWLDAQRDPAFTARLRELLRDYVGRPTPLYLAERLSEAAGRTVYLKREDLNHTGAHKINNALGQALLAKRMGKPRIIAETGAGQHGVATATACALLDLECVVYMGTEDMRRQKPNVERMGLLGRDGRAGRGRHAHAQGGLLGGDPRLGHERRHDALHHRLGRRPGAVPGARARPAARDRRRGARADAASARDACPQRVIACVGGGSNAIGIFTPFMADADVELIGVEAAGEGIETGRHGAPLTVGERPGILHGAYSAVMQDADGQILEAHSISAGLDYPGVGPGARVAARHRPRALRGRHRRRGARGAAAARAAGGDHPGARVLPRDRVDAARTAASDLDLVCLSGRGDKDLAEVIRRIEPERAPADDAATTRACRAARRRRERADRDPPHRRGVRAPAASAPR